MYPVPAAICMVSLAARHSTSLANTLQHADSTEKSSSSPWRTPLSNRPVVM